MARRLAGSVMAWVLGPLVTMACGGSSDLALPMGPTPSIPSGTVSPPPGPTGPVSSTHPLSGVYDLTLTLGDDCTAVPEVERTRRYTASIAYTTGGRYVVTLSSGRFLSGPICTGGSGVFAGLGCDQFIASEDIDMANFFLENNNDEAHGGHIVEQLASGTWIEVIGNATGPYDLRSARAAGSGVAWYCPRAASYPFPCQGSQSCQTSDLRLSLVRR